MSATNKAVALAFLDAMDLGDAGAMDRCLAPDVVTHTRGFGQVSGRRNRETMLGTTAVFREVVPTGLRITVHRVVAEGDTVMVEFEGDAVLSNGEPYANQYLFVFAFADGLIHRVDEYLCTALADRTILPLLAEKSHSFAHGD